MTIDQSLDTGAGHLAVRATAEANFAWLHTSSLLWGAHSGQLLHCGRARYGDRV
jgi:hypothetical protein